MGRACVCRETQIDTNGENFQSEFVKQNPSVSRWCWWQWSISRKTQKMGSGKLGESKTWRNMRCKMFMLLRLEFLLKPCIEFQQQCDGVCVMRWGVKEKFIWLDFVERVGKRKTRQSFAGSAKRKIREFTLENDDENNLKFIRLGGVHKWRHRSSDRHVTFEGESQGTGTNLWRNL